MSVEKTYKKLDNFFSQCINTIVSLMKVLIRSKFSVKLPFADAESCIILGNGPSLKISLQKHLEFFKQHPLVCVNSFSITQEYTLLKPGYYVILDHSFWMSEGEIVTDTLEAIKTRTTWEMYLFVPQISAKSKRFDELKMNPNLIVTYFNYTVFKGFPSIAHWLYSKNMAMLQSQNVLVASLFLSINLKFKKVYLFGADHTWHENLHLDDNNILSLKHIHFYDNEEKVNHIPFVKGVHLNETFKVHEIFTTWGKMFYGYTALEEYAKYKNCKIYNVSEVSFIDAFERKKL